MLLWPTLRNKSKSGMHSSLFVTLVAILGLTRLSAEPVSVPVSNRHQTFATVNYRGNDSRIDEIDDINEATNATASILAAILQNGEALNSTLSPAGYLNGVHDPLEVANELEYVVQYLKHGTQQGNNGSVANKTAGGKGFAEDKTADLTRVLDGFVVLNNYYDALVRPGQFDGDGPTTVTVQVFLHPWFEVDEDKNEMTLALTLIQNWTDLRLAYASRLKNPETFSYVTLTSQMHLIEVWLPDTVIVNEKRSFKHEVTVANDLVRITPQGQMSRQQKMTVTINCPFSDNKAFPFDKPVCSLGMASFSWNASQVRYQWKGLLPQFAVTILGSSKNVASNGFQLHSVDVRQDERRSQKGDSSVLIMNLNLERNLGLYVTKLYIPLASFALISIAGLQSRIGPQVGCVLSYFMFGLQSIFMGITFSGSDFAWGDSRTALDTYYMLCVATIFLTGLVNVFKLRKLNGNGKAVVESYEMYRNAASRFENSSVARRSRRSRPAPSDRLWNADLVDDSIEDDHDETGGGNNTGSSGGSTASFFQSVKMVILKGKRKCSIFCSRICDFSTVIILCVFITWNLYYWIKNLAQDQGGS